MPTVGFVGLGNMGSVLAGNLVASGHDVVAFDPAGSGRSPDGAAFARDVTEVAQQAEVVVCSLPDGRASEHVARAIAAAPGGRTAQVVDTSTIGVAAARTVDARLSGGRDRATSMRRCPAASPARGPGRSR